MVQLRDTSLSTIEILEELGTVQQIDDSLLLHLIYIYYANYVDGQNPEQQLSLVEIREIYQQSQQLLADFHNLCDATAQVA